MLAGAEEASGAGQGRSNGEVLFKMADSFFVTDNSRGFLSLMSWSEDHVTPGEAVRSNKKDQ